MAACLPAALLPAGGKLILKSWVIMSIKRKKSKEPVSRFPRPHRGSRYSMYRFVGTVGVLVIIALCVMIGAQYLQQLRVKQELADYEARLEEYEQRKRDLELEIERLQEIGYIEMLARDRLGLVKSDEVIFQLED